jgi:hypothetical protein
MHHVLKIICEFFFLFLVPLAVFSALVLAVYGAYRFARRVPHAMCDVRRKLVALRSHGADRDWALYRMRAAERKFDSFVEPEVGFWAWGVSTVFGAKWEAPWRRSPDVLRCDEIWIRRAHEHAFGYWGNYMTRYACCVWCRLVPEGRPALFAWSLAGSYFCFACLRQHLLPAFLSERIFLLNATGAFPPELARTVIAYALALCFDQAQVARHRVIREREDCCEGTKNFHWNSLREAGYEFYDETTRRIIRLHESPDREGAQSR